MKELKRFFRRRLALLLALTMAMTMVPSTLFAKEDGSAPVSVEAEDLMMDEPEAEAEDPIMDESEAEAEDPMMDEPEAEAEDPIMDEPEVEVEDPITEESAVEDEKPLLEEEAVAEEDPAMEAPNAVLYSLDSDTGTLTLCSDTYTKISYSWIKENDINPKLVKKLIIKNNIQEIQTGAFAACINLEEIELGDSVTTVETCAFFEEEDDVIKKITVGSGIESFVDLSKNQFMSLEEVVVNPRGRLFKMIDGVLYDNHNRSVVMANKSVTGERTLRAGTLTMEAGAFRNCKKLTSIIMPNSITTVEPRAFSGCTALKSVVFSENLEYISAGTFERCGLTKITIPASVEMIYDSAFSDCKKLTEVAFADNSSLSLIFSRVFYNCSSLTSINLPEKVIWICKQAFGHCTSLKTFKVHRAVTRLEAPFVGCTNLKVTISEKNENFCMVDNTIYTKNMKTIIECMDRTTKRFFVPNTVTKVAYAAFAECSNLQQISVPRRVAALDGMAFAQCANLESVTMPKTIAIDFLGCNALKSIYFLGTKTQWKNMQVDSKNPKATVVYNAMEPAEAPKTKIADDGLSVTVTTTAQSYDSTFYYHFLRRTDGGALKNLKKSEYKSWTDSTVLGAHTYDYAIQYRNADGDPISDYGQYATVVTPDRKLSAPTVKSAVNVAAGVKVSWKAVKNAEYYEVLRKGPGDKSWRSCGTTTKTSYTVKKLDNGAAYIFTVRCVSPNGKKVWSSYGKSCAAVLYLKATSIVSAVSKGSGKLTVSWKKNGKASGYQVEYSMNKKFRDSKKAEIGKNSTLTKTLEKLVKGRVYYVRVRAKQKVGRVTHYSGWCSPAAVQIRR